MELRERFRAMGSPCELRLHASSAAHGQEVIVALRATIEALEQRYSRYRPDSLTARINAAAGGGAWVELDAASAGLLDYAEQAFAASDGLFDLTSGVLRRAWDFRSGRLPAAEAVAALLPLVGWRQVERQESRVRLPRAGMELDFGGLVKEHAVDVAVDLCRRHGIAAGLVELGGDIGVIGPHPDGTPWRIGIRDPRAPDAALAHVDVAAGALATSGDYERCIEVGGRRYGHILDPRSGWPVAGLASASVVAARCLVAGTASTIALLRGGQGSAWLAELGLPHLAVTASGAVIGNIARPATAVAA